MTNLRSIALLLCFLALAAAATPRPKPTPPSGPRFEITFSAAQSPNPLDGRVFLLLSTSERDEPRFQITDHPDTQQFFGVDVDNLAPGVPAVVDVATLGYPLENLSQIPAGDYYVQGVLNIYETFHRADGHLVKLPPDRGEGQQWNRKPGNLYSKPQKVHLDPAAGATLRISLTEKIAPIEPPQDTKYVKHFTIQSQLLSRFWGRPMYLGAIVVLPQGFDEHPDAHYPLLVDQGHFPDDFRGFREQPPDPGTRGPARESAEYAYKLYQDWTSGRLPHMLLLLIQHANPYYDDSYAVNSANVGPTATPSPRN